MRPPLTPNAWLRFDAIRRAVARTQPRSVLEIGPGQGALALWLAERARYVGVEHDDRSRAVAQARLAARHDETHARVVASLDAVAEPSFDLVCAFEVLEHIEDDAGALRDWRARVAPDGRLLLSVPAHRERFGPSDELVGHHRRYDRDDLGELLGRCGFRVESLVSYGFGLGSLLDAARNRIARRSHPAPTIEERTAASGRHLQPRPGVVAAAVAVAVVPFRVVQAPFARGDRGTGYVALACRSDQRR